jgi:hypothetical protein
MNNMNWVRRRIVKVALLVAFATAAYAFTKMNPLEHLRRSVSVCQKARYKKLTAGMSASDVIRVLGEPQVRKKRTSPSDWSTWVPRPWKEAPLIMESWTYRLRPWRGTIEVYMDKDGVVLGNSCSDL